MLKKYIKQINRFILPVKTLKGKPQSECTLWELKNKDREILTENENVNHRLKQNFLEMKSLFPKVP